MAVFLGVVVLTKGKGNGNAGSGISHVQGREERRQRQKQQQKYSRPRQEDIEANESGLSASSTGSAELDGVTLLNDPPLNANADTHARRQKAALADNSVRPYPSTAIPGLRQVRKHSSFGTFPTSRSYTGPSSTAWPGTAVATPLVRPTRMPSLTTTKVFSPGYLLIAGGGFGALEDILSSSNESGTEDEEGGHQDGGGRQSSGSDSGDGDEDEDELLVSQLEGPDPQPEDARHEDGTTMTSSQIMRRSGTI